MKRTFAKEIDFGIPIISIGNIIVGGSGKTPVTIKLASEYEDACVVLRGYGRKSKGLFVVSKNGKILEDVKTSGDEAMVLAKALPNSTIIVSEDRKKAILKAKELDCKIVFLDDGFSKYEIKKFNILLRPKNEPTSIYCLPSGCYREPKGFYSYGDLLLHEGVDFNREVTIKSINDTSILKDDLLLLTSISKPKRLLEFLPKDTKMESFPDHHSFTNDEINQIIKTYKNFSIVTTSKDFVKLEQFNIKNLYLMQLDITFSNTTKFSLMKEYIKNYE